MRHNHLFRRLGLVAIAAYFIASGTACSATLQKNTTVDQNTSTVIQVIQNTVDSISDDSFTNEEATGSYARDLEESIESCGYTLQKATLVRVVDGDTIVVDIDGEETRVRLIGVNTPESVASQEYLDKTGKENTEEGKEASEFTKEILANYNEIYLQKDISETDKYGRTLRYVWLEVPSNCDDIEEIRTKMLNGILLDNGYAEVTTYYPDSKYCNEFEQIADNYYDRSN